MQAAQDFAGFSVGGAGDVDGDGYADVLVGLPLADPLGRDAAGAAVLVMGMPGATLDAAAAGAALRTHRFLGAAASDNLGLSLASAGDLNGDGLADFVLGAPNADPLGRVSAGSAFVVFGRRDGLPSEVDLAAAGGWGFRVEGARAGALLGSAVAAAGDVNGDGFGDLLLGAPNEADGSGAPVGAVYLLFGSAALAASGSLDLAEAASGRWVALRGGAEGDPPPGIADGAGAAVAGGGDVNGDGFADFAIGAPGAGGGRGSVFLVLGHGGGWTDIALRDMTAGQGERIDGVDGSMGSFGAAVAVNGDGNGDGRSDLLVGAPFQGSTGNRPGEAWLVFSQGTPGGPVTLRGTTLAESLGGGAGNDSLTGFGGSDVLVGRGGDDTLLGGEGGDTLLGQEGDDILQGGSEDNLLDGGPGRDAASYAASAHAVVANLASGVVVTAPFAFTLDRLVAIEDWTGSAQDDIAFGSDFANALAGGGGRDALYGLAGNDTLLGGEGDDLIQGGSGVDRLVGGAGSDVYAITDLGDTVIEDAADPGRDQALVEVNGWTVAANIELINLVGAAFRLTGSGGGEAISGNATLANSIDGAGGDDEIFGAAFADILRGGAGDDVLRAMGGNALVGDTLIGGAGADQMVGAARAADVFLYDAAGWAPAPGAVAAGGRIADEIFGFERGTDVLQFRPASGVSSMAGFAAIHAFAVQVEEGGRLVDRTNVQIVGRDGSLIHVYGLDANTTLTREDFVFG